MKVFLTAAILIMVAYQWSAARAQQADTLASVKKEFVITTETAEAPTSKEEVTGEHVVRRESETEAQREARIQKTKFLEAQADNCNQDFMGLPKEHEVCIQKIVDQITDETPGGDSNVEENIKNE